VSLTLNRTSLRTSDTLIVSVVGTNTSTQTIQVPNSPCPASLDVRNERDEAVAFGDPRYCILPLYPPKLVASGATWGETLTLLHVSPGQYRVRGGLPAEASYVYSDFTTVRVVP
jgi:hypothetical protein